MLQAFQSQGRAAKPLLDPATAGYRGYKRISALILLHHVGLCLTHLHSNRNTVTKLHNLRQCKYVCILISFEMFFFSFPIARYTCRLKLEVTGINSTEVSYIGETVRMENDLKYCS